MAGQAEGLGEEAHRRGSGLRCAGQVAPISQAAG